ncbi:MAG: DNA (cytosine-5-)-methyltransferase [Fermentimonas sp.]|jgi:DNA (cytosine-5)-methyltransferase 1
MKKKYILGDFADKEYIKRLGDDNSEALAILTHYIHDTDNLLYGVYEEEANEVSDEYAEYKVKQQPFIDSDAVISQLLFEIENVPFPTPDNHKFDFIDLFAGVGGFRIAMQSVGGRCTYTSEWNEAAKITYARNFGQIPFGDITKEHVKNYIPERFDVLCAGFPCQAFSIAGYRKGFSDTRGTLFFDIEEIVNKHRPKIVFLENVKNLVTHDKGKTFKVIREILEKKLGYKVFYKVMNSMTYANVPQNRERIFIVAFDPEQVERYNSFRFPKEIPLTKTIKDVLSDGKQKDKYYYKTDHKYYPILDREMTSDNTLYQWRRVYVRENKSNVCPTLTANMGTGGHNVPLVRDEYGIRKLTPKECFGFQGYPIDKYILPNIADSKLYMQAGNSVTVPLIERISQEIVKVLI